MTSRAKLWIANVLMVLGIVPLLLGLSWILAVIGWARQHQGQMGGSDAFLMLGVLLVGYAFALLVSGGSAVWSARVARRDTGAGSRVSAIIRSGVCVVLLVPLLWYAGVSLSLF